MIAVTTVTSAAIPTVRKVIVRYTASLKRVTKLFSDHSVTTWPVKMSVLQNAVTNNAASAPR